ncbi:hypothetical protein CC85DRAFT_299251 [Cutaneotrichosporon oleaginosum]|uniref:Uncharacterized protein n=1 Tax=Cutaneotrichosporon oleaginosum TaxID=879819 RepID=A0A0J0XWZ9_9TREE|nr:uncharacterized protein CC85DRAFT_299251 [Cutaneotrichosporon oleaginosum]KLT45592.1 hypothetical protein CC85DRAFT_299251 [Cutaneotrichosporon oleaginosum]TXT04611.1 hypothetical protein COLE_07430 [Cutaneotrichosporon oleaginosum]
MSRRSSVAESTLSRINWGSVPPPLMPPSAKTPENPLRRLSMAASELPARAPDSPERRQRRESLAALYPPTPEGVIALARDAASNHSSYWTNVYLLLILPPVLAFALARRAGAAAAAHAASTYALLTQDPSDPEYTQAGAVQIAAHLLLVPVLIATLYLARDHPLVEYAASALLGITVVALLPMRPLAGVIRTMGRARARTAAHVGAHVEIYVLLATVLGIALGLYALIDYINDEIQYEHFAREGAGQIQSELAQQVVALRAELAALKAAAKATANAA